MDLTEFLRHRDADLPAVVTAIRARVGIVDGDVLLAVGSLVEGLGNAKSDVDLLLVTERGRDALPERDELAVVVGRCVVDLHVLRRDDLLGLVERFRASARSSWEVAHPVAFSQSERVLLHRLVHGLQLVDAPPEHIAALTPSREDLCRLELRVARHFARTVQVDLVGYRGNGDHATATMAAQDLLGYAVDALNAGHARSHPNHKWRLRLIERLPDDWAQALPRPTAPRDAVATIWALLRAPERPTAAACDAHATRILAFARAVFAWAEWRLVRPDFPWRSLVRGEVAPGGAPLAALDHDVDFHLGRGDALLARLNEFEAPVPVTPRELAAALLFDGATTAAQVAALVGEDGGGDAVAALHARLTAAGLTRAGDQA